MPWHGLHASTFLPCLPSDEFCCLVLQRHRSGHRNGTMRALTPRRLAHADKVSLLALLCLPSIPSPTTPWARPSPSHPRRCSRPDVATQASSWKRRLAAPQRRNGFVILRAARSPPAAPHPASRIRAVGRRSRLRLLCGVTSHGLDFHLLTQQHHRRTFPDSRATRGFRDDTERVADSYRHIRM